MIGLKLAKILQSLTPDEFRRLKRALSSPYFATNPRLLDFYDHLKKHYPDFEEEKLPKDKLFKKLYPGKPFNDGVLRVLVREFTCVVEDYIMLERLRNDKLQRKKSLVKEYSHRNLYEYFKKGTEELLNEIDGDFEKDMEYFGDRIELFQGYCFHPLTNTYDAKDESLERLMDSLDAYFVLAKYRFVQVLNNRNNVLGKKSEHRFFDMILESQEGFFVENKLITLYGLINKLYDTNDEKYFLELKKIFFQNIEKIKRTDSRIIYFIGLNFCSRKINTGDSDYIKEQFEWYKKGLKNDLLTDNNRISDATFNNIVSAACFKKEFIWIENFMERYSSFLDPDVREDVLCISKASLCFSKGDFKKALQLYTTHNYSISYHLNVRSNTITTVFEQALIDSSYFNILQSYIDSHKKYIQRNTYFSENVIVANKNYLKLIEKFSNKIRSNESRNNIKRWLVKELDKNEALSLRRWFEAKLNTLLATKID